MQGPALAAARVLRAVELAVTRGDAEVLRDLERVAQAYLEAQGEDLSQERADAARSLRASIGETCKSYQTSTHTITDIAAVIAGLIMALLMINGDAWSADIRSAMFLEGGPLTRVSPFSVGVRGV